MQTVLTIAGYDPSSGAGITADLMVFAAHGLFGTSAITALTVQSTTGVVATHLVDPEILVATLDCLQADLPPAGIKIGMLGSAGMVSAVAGYVRGLRERGRPIPVVLDPVLRSSSGRELLDAEGLGVMRAELLPVVDWITPNRGELAELGGRPAGSEREAVEAARGVQEEFARLHVLVTGGDQERPDDLLMPAGGGEAIRLEGERVHTRSTHGTGCALSSALLCRLVLGDGAEAAARGAKAYVAGALRSATAMGQGQGPMNHLWRLRERK